MSVATPVIDYIDGTTRRIYLLQGVDAFHWIEDVYREYINRRNINEDLRKYYPLMRQAGNDPKGGGKYTPRYITLINGCRVIPYDENILITVTGEAITDNADVDPDPFDTSTRVQPLKLYITPPSAEIVRDEVSLAAIAFMSFNNKVTVDVINGDSIAGFTGDPRLLGNSQYPVDSFEDGLTIANYYGMKNIDCVDSASILAGDFSGFSISGGNHVNVTITIDEVADVTGTRFDDARLEGSMDGSLEANTCVIGDVSGVSGHMHSCALGGTVVLSSSGETLIRDSTRLDNENLPTVDFNDDASHLVMSGWTGIVKFINMTSPLGNVMVGMSQGVIILDSATVTSGQIQCIGLGYLKDELGNLITTGTWNGVTIVNNLVSNESISDVESLDFLTKVVKNKRVITTAGDAKTLHVYDDDNVTPILTKSLKDPSGANIADLPAGSMTQELKTSV